MRKSQGKKRLVLIATLICSLVVVPALAGAASTTVSKAQPLMTIAVTNNSTREILHLYLSPADHDAWGPDLFSEGTTLRGGETFTISGAACTGNEIKVIAEDRQGCFVYGLVGCSEASASWTITDTTPTDCGN